ncbi:MAG: DoxX family protein [Acidobacteria bacterium]|nr:MAG: DoxX family protein [Acidobacteriota bacterium]
MVGLGLLVLRIALAVVFFAHGGNKLFGLFGGPGIGSGGLTSASEYFTTLGIHPAFLFAVIESVLEVAGSILIGLGFLTRWASAALAISMGVAIWKAHLPWGFFLNWTGAAGRGHGMEYALVLCLALVALALTGGGDLSVDGMNQRSADRDAAGRARLRGKV